MRAVRFHYLFTHQLQIIGSRGGTRRELRQLLEQVAARRLRSVIHARYPLEAAAEAHREMEERRQFGKLLLIP